MQGIILAAGVSKRLRPLTDVTPKCLLEIDTKNILHRTIDNLTHNGIKEIIIVTGYKEEMIKEYVSKNLHGLDVQYITNSDHENNNNSYSLWMTKDYVKGDALLLDSDIVFDKAIITSLLNSKHENAIAVNCECQADEEQIKVTMDTEGKVTSIGKEIKLSDSHGESIGIEKFSAYYMKELYNILEDRVIKQNLVNEFYERSFQEIIQKNDPRNSIYGIDVSEYKCMEIDTIDDFNNAQGLNI
ncbi:phosphocholine cytidylyltransferase family protein [soil metagenome]